MFIVDGLKVLAVATVSDIERILKEGRRNRALLTTEMNSFSIHCSTVIFQLKFVQKCLNKIGQMINKSSMINFVDLPASGAQKYTDLYADYNTIHNLLFDTEEWLMIVTYQYFTLS